MILERVFVKNFRQFLGHQEVIFSTSSIKPLTLINGRNGTGKSNLVTAIKWALFGCIGLVSTKEDEVVLSWQIARALEPYETAKSVVEVTFSHQDNKYKISREVKYRKLEGNVERIDDSFTAWNLATGARVSHPMGLLAAITQQDNNIGFFPEPVNESNGRWLASILTGKESSDDDKALIMDSPFLRVSRDYKDKLAKAMFGLKGQLIMLVLDVEMIGIHKMLVAKVGKEYDLLWDDKTYSTKIVQVTKY